MIERDRKLLARLRRVNQHLGGVVVEMLAQQDGGELPAEPLHTLGRNLAEMSAELLGRAAELDGRMLEYPERVIIDAQAVETV